LARQQDKSSNAVTCLTRSSRRAEQVISAGLDAQGPSGALQCGL